MNTEFYLNRNNGRVVPWTPVLEKYARNKNYFVPSDEKGNMLVSEEPDQDYIDQLSEDLMNARSEIEILKDRLAKYEGTEQITPTPETVELAEEEDDPEASKMEALVRACGTLDVNNPDHFTTTGLPYTEILETFSGYDEVTSGERDQAWAQFQEEA